MEHPPPSPPAREILQAELFSIMMGLLRAQFLSTGSLKNGYDELRLLNAIH